MKRNTYSQLILLPVLALTCQGCIIAAIGAGAGTFAYLNGKFSVILPNDLSAVCTATRAALKKMKITPTFEKCDSLSGKYVAQNAMGKKITILLSSTPSDQTNLSIRVGPFGNQDQSLTIYENIKKNL